VRTFGTPPSVSVPPALTRRLSALKLRGRAFLESASAQAAARRELGGLRYDVARLRADRERLLRDHGGAVYASDEAGTERGRAAIRDLDHEIAAKEDRMTEIALQAQAHVAQVQAEARQTQLLEPPPPAPPTPPTPAPEPYPPPDEGTPPTPAPVPEPYPPPDEGDLPNPDET
jgi:outer membrane biosynthesis protein TonB